MVAVDAMEGSRVSYVETRCDTLRSTLELDVPWPWASLARPGGGGGFHCGESITSVRIDSRSEIVDSSKWLAAEPS